ncbi:hypothetical protein [Knoellia koreensis]|jgi:hypothetical protein|uniref:Uncharacterized protein n=1 Tax=Knoellia koreensis TaxID=2730921 RepID=A0A849HN05_9MICO|nr:hypothetical protein [Knoellia sp. DB2414S]NNM47771.1 hypothetical protein [Knoellia sp. DB2414S]
MTPRPTSDLRIAPAQSFAPAAERDPGWGRRRLLAVLAAATISAVLLLTGLGYAIHFALTPAEQATPVPAELTHGNPPSGIRPDGSPAAGLTRDERRDRIAAAPMPPAPPADAQPAPPATQLADPITIPPATTAGPAMVPSGFPRTPEGAVAQLAAIETTVLQAMSIPVVHAVHEQWALPGGVGPGEWSLTGHVRSFLGAARMGAEKDLRTVVMATPAAAQVKGTDGPDWVLACVLLEVRAVIESEARIGYGHCERMRWQPIDTDDPNQTGTAGGRWMIAPGDPPAVAPSTWPGSEPAIAAGWKTWVDAEPAAAAGSHDPAATAPTAGAGAAEDRG